MQGLAMIDFRADLIIVYCDYGLISQVCRNISYRVIQGVIFIRN